MARTPLAERPGPLKVLGVLFVAMVVFFVWLTYAVFNKTFVDFDEVTLTGKTAGLNLPENADIKLRGMIVGEVRGIKSENGKVEITLGMKPELIDEVPANVSAQILPKTLFGEKFISLIAPDNPSKESLKAGDTIQRAEVPIEVETLLNDIYPLLRAVDPANLSYTLTAVAQALDGRGEKLGNTLVTLNNYLQKLNPDTPQLVDDLVQLGDVADGYADQLPTIGRLLRNTTFTGNTVVAKRAQLAAFLDEGTRLGNTLTKFVKANGDNLEALAKQGRPSLQIAANYSSTFPCFLGAMARILPRADSALRNRTVHIDLKVLDEQPTPYAKDERAVLPAQSKIDNEPAAQPGKGGVGQVCNDLTTYSNVLKKNPDATAADSAIPYDAEKPYPGPAPSVYQLLGVKTSHNNKFGSDADFQRAPAVSLQGTDSEEERLDLRRMAAAMSGRSTADIPDVASLLLSPVVRGAEGSIR